MYAYRVLYYMYVHTTMHSWLAMLVWGGTKQCEQSLHCTATMLLPPVYVVRGMAMYGKSHKKCPDVLSVLLGTDSTTVRSTVSTTVHSTVSTYVRYALKKVSIRKGKVHGRDGEASCPTRTTTQRFYRPMPLLSLYLVLSRSSSSFSLDRQLTSLGPHTHVRTVCRTVSVPRSTHVLNIKRT